LGKGENRIQGSEDLSEREQKTERQGERQLHVASSMFKVNIYKLTANSEESSLLASRHCVFYNSEYMQIPSGLMGHKARG
jgi:hypothetical protein